MAKSKNETNSVKSGGNLIRKFLSAMESRDLDSAKTMLAPDFSMTFPGGFKPSGLEDLVAWSKTRYKSVHKTHDRIDEIETADSTIVYIHGTLYGEWLDGTAFSGVRYIDRFTIRNGKIADQNVWNDTAEKTLFRRLGLSNNSQLSGP